MITSTGIFSELDEKTAGLYRRFIIQSLVMNGIQPNDTCTNEELLEWAAHFPGVSDWGRFQAWGQGIGHMIPARQKPVMLFAKPLKGRIKFSEYRQRVQGLYAALVESTVKEK